MPSLLPSFPTRGRGRFTTSIPRGKMEAWTHHLVDLRIQRIVQAIAQKVEGKDDQGHHKPRNQH